MTVFILGNKQYDTKKAEEIIKYLKSVPFTAMGVTFSNKRETTLYRTQKGNWFSVTEIWTAKFKAFEESDDSVREIFKALNEVELYNQYFGQLEEA